MVKSFDEKSPVNLTIVQRLISDLGPTLVAVVSGTRLRQNAYRWESGNSMPTSGEYEQIAFAANVFNQVADTAGEDIARAWFIGQNTVGFPPYLAIRLGLLEETESSAKRFIDEMS